MGEKDEGKELQRDNISWHKKRKQISLSAA